MNQAVRLKPPSFMEKLIRLVYPAKCMVCDTLLKEDTTVMLCESCHALLPRCEKGFAPAPFIPYIHELFASYYYSEGLELAIHAMKFNHQPKLSETFAFLLFEEMAKAPFLPDWDMILPIPMHPKKKRQRGYNPSELIAEKLSVFLDIPIYCNLLVKNRPTKPQSRLKREERLFNLEGAFDVVNEAEIAGKNILLVDDVVTTGTTLNTCAKILYEKGASFIFALVTAIVEK